MIAAMGRWIFALLPLAAIGRVPIEPAANLMHAMTHHEVLHLDDFTLTQRQRRDGTIQHHFQFSAFNETFQIKLQQDEQLFAHGIEVFTTGQDGELQPYRFEKRHYLAGTVVNHDGDSEVKLYINDGFVLGTIDVGHERYYIEPSRFHYNDSSAQMVVYAKSHLKPDGWKMGGKEHETKSFCSCGANTTHHSDGHSHDYSHSHENNHDHSHPEPRSDWFSGKRSKRHLPKMRQRSRRNQASDRFNTCLMTVVADSRLYQFFESSAADVTAHMMRHVEESSRIFRATNFGGVTGLGLAVRRVIIEDNAATDPFRERSTWKVGEMLEQFSFSYTFDQSCLAHLFTRVDFVGGTLGLAWVGSPEANRQGGLCHKNANQYLNTGLTTNINFGNNVPFATTALVTAHEIGHNWGAAHDERAPCTVSNTDPEGNYLMYAIAVDGSKPNNNQLSPCSISSISAVIQSKGDCFSIPPEGICGNRRLERAGQDGKNGTEDDEVCDAGQGDSCCSSSCKFLNSATCSPANNACCNQNTCRGFEDALKHTCFQSFAFDEQCRSDAYCVNPDSPFCEVSQPKPIGTPCGNGGRCTNTNDDPLTRCTSFCARFGGVACDCSDDDECRTCCKHDPEADCGNVNGTCGCPFRATANTCVKASAVLGTLRTDRPGLPITCYQDQENDTNTHYSEADNPKLDPTCVDTEDSKCQRILNKLSGTSCSIGVCNSNGVCETPETGVARFGDGIGSLSVNAISEWARENIVGAVMLATFIVWLPICICIARYDHNQRKINADYGTANRAAGTMARKVRRKNSRMDAAEYARRRSKRGARPAADRPSASGGRKFETRPKKSSAGAGGDKPKSSSGGGSKSRSNGGKSNGGARQPGASRSKETIALSANKPARSKPKTPTASASAHPKSKSSGGSKQPSAISLATNKPARKQDAKPRSAAAVAAAALHSSQDSASGRGPARRGDGGANGPQRRQPQVIALGPSRGRGDSAANMPRPNHSRQAQRQPPHRMNVQRDARSSASERNRQALGYQPKGRLATDVV
eukprot:TRINITY_DN5994_c0_g1_i1.p1 TRINITY_DN5994_c0_g1~~TRINITY_DN5994_c0_g1_i1.p1  ORF type:complete len:1038 (+),score=218.04 TRINITY_DN5994_c0_g1_i1:223-3336(+)